VQLLLTMSNAHASPVSALGRYSSMPPCSGERVSRSSFPAPITQVRISIAPRAPMNTMPPAARAAKMLKTVRQVAMRMARRLPRHIDVEDLVGAGALGLADAFSRRNGMPGSEFEAFASYRVRGAILDELRRLDAMPRRTRTRAKEVAQAHRAVEQRSGTAAQEEEVAKELGLDMPAYQAMRAKLEASRGPVALHSATNEDDDGVHEIEDARAEMPDVAVARTQIGEMVVEGINTLPERMRRVLVGLYVEGDTLKDIGTALGVSESRVCQIHTEALGILRAQLSDDQDDGAAPPVSTVRARGNVFPIRPQLATPVRRMKRA
jgi:RNA polymerase sigma factor for flagellar operon FliA